jgi:hypothetical protein
VICEDDDLPGVVPVFCMVLRWEKNPLFDAWLAVVPLQVGEVGLCTCARAASSAGVNPWASRTARIFCLERRAEEWRL